MESEKRKEMATTFASGSMVFSDDETIINELMTKYNSNNDRAFSVDEVKGIIKDALKIERNKRSKNVKSMLVLMTLLGGFIALLASIFAMSWAIVGLTQKISISSGGMLVDSHTGESLKTISTGNSYSFNLHYNNWGEEDHDSDSSPFVCAKAAEVARMWNATVSGSPTTVVTKIVDSQDDEQGLLPRTNISALAAGGSYMNQTHICFHQQADHHEKEDHFFCFDMKDDRCMAYLNEDGRRQLQKYGSGYIRDERRRALQAALNGRRRRAANQGDYYFYSGSFV